MSSTKSDPAVDVLYGLAAIGAHLGITARQAETIVNRRDIPTFKLGRIVCARRSTLARHFAEQEAAAQKGGERG